MIWRILAIAMVLDGLALPAIRQARNPQKQNAQDKQVQKIATEKLQEKEKFRGVSASVEDGIVTL